MAVTGQLSIPAQDNRARPPRGPPRMSLHPLSNLLRGFAPAVEPVLDRRGATQHSHDIVHRNERLALRHAPARSRSEGTSCPLGAITPGPTVALVLSQSASRQH